MVDVAGSRAGTVTVVFTDLVDSTVLRQTLGDDQADELRRDHDKIVRDAVLDHSGTEVKALGDGFMLVFSAAAEAVSAAVAMQQSIERFARRAPIPVRIRVGVSAGDVVWENGDCFGTPVVEASRLCGATDGGKILVSDVVRLLAGSRGGHRFHAIGALDLKGLTEPLGASEVAWESLSTSGTLELPRALTTAEQGRYVGRAEERERVKSAWKDSATGKRRLVLISGEPGVGKTRLAAELSHAAHADGATVLYGRCDEDLGVPYQPFVEALAPYVAACPADELAEQVAPYGGDLSRLVPQVAERVHALPDALRADPETERYRLFTAVTSFIASIAGTGTLVLVLDDLHWAAKPTLLLLRHLTTAEWAGPLLIIATYRDTDLSRTHPLAEMLADLRREGDVERVALHGLDPQEVEEFLTAAAGHDLPDEGTQLARMLHDETEGNPFFMGQVLRHLVESGAIVERDGRWVGNVSTDELGIPEGVREVVGRRLARLDEATNEVLAAAAVIGRDFDHDVLTAAAAVDSEAVLDALEQAERARLIASDDARRGRYGFVHALVRSTLYDEIPTTRRLRLHRRIGEALEARDVDAHLDELAYHFAESAALGDGPKAVDYGRRAAARALDRLAYEEAALDYERALSSLDTDNPADRAPRAELLIELGRSLWTAGERGRARVRLTEAVELARQIRRLDLFTDAAITIGGARGWTEAGVVDDVLVEWLEEAITTLPPGDSAHRARAMVRLSAELYFLQPESDRRRELAVSGVAMARRLDDPVTLAYVLNASHWALYGLGNADEREQIAREILAIATSTEDLGLEANAVSWLVTDLAELGDMTAAIAMAARELAIAEELRQPEMLWVALAHQGAIAQFEGRLDDAERLVEEALAMGQQTEVETAAQMYGVAQLALRRLRGGLEEMIPITEAMVDRYPLVPAWRSGLAYVYRELGMRDEARAQLDIVSADYDSFLPPDGNWIVGVAVLSTVCQLVGAAEEAAVLYARLLPYEDCFVLAGVPADILGSAHHFLMLLAGTAQQWVDMEHHASEALTRNESMGGRAWATTTRFELANMLSQRLEQGDADRARSLLDECLAACDELRMPALAARAHAVRETLDSSGSGT